MEVNKKKKKAPVKKVTRPYLTGSPVDCNTAMSVVRMVVSQVIMLIAFLFFGAMMIWDHLLLRIATNGALLLGAYLIFWQSGASAGTIAVNQGEILYQRRETGRAINPSELSVSYHPAKGFIQGLLGCVPLFVCALVLALTAKIQMTGMGALPSWLTPFESREEIGAALTIYYQDGGLALGDVMRLIVRMALMPVVNLVGSGNPQGMLLMERISPILVLLPGLSYGVGYLQGVSVRTQVHTEIAAGKRKQKRREKKARQKRQAQRTAKGPEKLN